jgi:hypothetical protein
VVSPSDSKADTPEPFVVVPVDPSLAQITEQMGSKDKFWFDDPTSGRTLFKAARQGSGEDWAEKVAQELCTLLGLPHAGYELANAGNVPGVITPSFVSADETLIHGNELLAGASAKYAFDVQQGGGRSSQYTVALVLETLEASGATVRAEWDLPDSINTAVDVFVGYLLLDAWIGNTDRHQENWGITERLDQAGKVERCIAPQFDSASCLGRNESDAKRNARLTSTDPKFTIESYAARARSPLFASEGSSRPLDTLGAFIEAARIRPVAAEAWLRRLEQVDDAAVQGILDRVPSDRLSMPARQFALRMLGYNRSRLLKYLGALA